MRQWCQISILTFSPLKPWLLPKDIVSAPRLVDLSRAFRDILPIHGRGGAPGVHEQSLGPCILCARCTLGLGVSLRFRMGTRTPRQHNILRQAVGVGTCRVTYVDVAAVARWSLSIQPRVVERAVPNYAQGCFRAVMEMLGVILT